MDNPVSGTSSDSAVAAVKGENTAGGDSVVGSCTGASAGVGVRGKSTNNIGIIGESDDVHGIVGICHNHLGAGVIGTSDKGGFGVIGESATGTAVQGQTDTGVAVHGRGGKLAGLFEGDVEVAGALTVSGQNVDKRLADLEARLESRIDAGFADFLRGRMWELERIQYLVLYMQDQVFDLIRPAVADLVARSGLPPFPPVPPYDFTAVDPVERHHG